MATPSGSPGRCIGQPAPALNGTPEHRPDGLQILETGPNPDRRHD